MNLTINLVLQNLVPAISEEEYKALKQSIKENGLWMPIIVNSKGEILLKPKMRIPAHEKWLIDNPKRLKSF